MKCCCFKFRSFLKKHICFNIPENLSVMQSVYFCLREHALANIIESLSDDGLSYTALGP